ncbi:MAG: oligoendopeptidase F [candidate division Zixibacteria bacterium]|nr:oligoendopeptidase F [candidate division Zixibacteria bacterium]
MQSKNLLRVICLGFFLGLSLAAISNLFAQSNTVPQRTDIDNKYKWDLSHIYPDWETWATDLARLEQLMNDYAALKGTLAGGPENLFKAYKLSDELDMLAYKVYRFPQLSRALDNRDNEIAARMQQVAILFSKFGVATSWFSPEMLAIPRETMEKWLNEYESLAPYRFPIENAYRQQKHVLDEEKEKLLSYFSPFNSTPGDIHNELAVSDMDYARTVLSDGDTVVLTPGNYRRILAGNRNQADRAKAFEAYYKVFTNNINTHAAIYNGILQRDWATAQARNYNSSLEAALDGYNVPVAAFENLVNTASKNVEPLRRYYRLRKKMLGLETYHGYDGSLPIVEYDKTYEYDEILPWMAEAFKPLGKDYVNMVREALDNNWVDVYETEGKSTGGYSANVYGVHSFILMNYNKTLDDAFTLAHELGHALHSRLANRTQPKATADYTLLGAEVASTLNEALFLDFLLKNTKDPLEKITILQRAIDNIEGTFYTQVMFTDFELSAHRLAEQGQPITAEVLNDLYEKIWTKQSGDAIVFDKPYGATWARISHFYEVPYYVYQYAFSFAASSQLFEQISSPDKKVRSAAVERYLNYLKSGGNDYPMELIKKAGVDMTTTKPFEAVVNRLDYLVSQLEQEITRL